jgi:hypothetical protein
MSEMFSETKKYLAKLKLPLGDLYDLPTSKMTYPDGAQYKIEVTTVNTPHAIKTIVGTAKSHGVTINRVVQTHGIMRYTDEELEEMIETARDLGVELIHAHGPRAKYDIGAQARTESYLSHAVAYRLRGMDEILRAIEDIKRGISLGARSFLIFDEGLLSILGNMRRDEIIPKDTHFKVSVTTGHCNPASARILESLGADTINVQSDLTLPMIAAIRQAVNVPLDLHTDTMSAAGSFIRTYEVPEFVRIAAPVDLKTGGGAITVHGILDMPDTQLKRMAEQSIVAARAVKKYMPTARQSTTILPPIKAR